MSVPNGTKNGSAQKADGSAATPNRAASALASVEARRKRKETVALYKLGLLAVLFGIAVGTCLFYTREIVAFFKPVGPRPRPAKVATQEVDEQEFLESEEVAARNLLIQGSKHLTEMSFPQAQKLFAQAAALRARPATREEAGERSVKASEFDLATRHVPLSDFATSDNFCAVLLKDNSVCHGLIVERTTAGITLQMLPAENPGSGAVVKRTVPTAQVVGVQTVGREARLDLFRALLPVLTRSLPQGAAGRPADYYDVVCACKRLGLGLECCQYLERAYALAPDHKLSNAFRWVVVNRQLEHAAFLAAMGQKDQAETEVGSLLAALPDFAPAQKEVASFRRNVLDKLKGGFVSTLVKTPAAGESPEGELRVSSVAVVGRGAAAALVAEANKLYEEGLTFYSRFNRGPVEQNNKVLTEAKTRFEKAVKLYGQALDVDAENRAVANRQVEANMLVYACDKYQTMH